MARAEMELAEATEIESRKQIKKMSTKLLSMERLARRATRKSNNGLPGADKQKEIADKYLSEADKIRNQIKSLELLVVESERIACLRRLEFEKLRELERSIKEEAQSSRNAKGIQSANLALGKGLENISMAQNKVSEFEQKLMDKEKRAYSVLQELSLFTDDEISLRTSAKLEYDILILKSSICDLVEILLELQEDEQALRATIQKRNYESCQWMDKRDSLMSHLHENLAAQAQNRIDSNNAIIQNYRELLHYSRENQNRILAIKSELDELLARILKARF